MCSAVTSFFSRTRVAIPTLLNCASARLLNVASSKCHHLFLRLCGHAVHRLLNSKLVCSRMSFDGPFCKSHLTSSGSSTLFCSYSMCDVNSVFFALKSCAHLSGDTRVSNSLLHDRVICFHVHVQGSVAVSQQRHV